MTHKEYRKELETRLKGLRALCLEHNALPGVLMAVAGACTGNLYTVAFTTPNASLDAYIHLARAGLINLEQSLVDEAMQADGATRQKPRNSNPST